MPLGQNSNMNSTINGDVQQNSKVITIGAKPTENDDAVINEDGELREAKEIEIKQTPSFKNPAEFIDNLPFKKYLIPAALIIGLIALITAIISIFRSDR